MSVIDPPKNATASDQSLFQNIIDQGETVLWTGHPKFWPFVLRAIPILIVGALWGAIDYAFFFGTNVINDPGARIFTYPFLALHSFPAWGSVLYAIYLVLSCSRTTYAYSNRRLLLRNGVIAPAYRSLDYDAVKDMNVGVNVLERIFGAGTVTASTGAGTPTSNLSFCALADPYAVFKAVKQIEVDVKTDWEYPNALRPDENPGYHTKYARKP